MSKESTEEASAVHAKQVNYEKEIADMSLTISKLQTSLREAQKKSFHDNPNSEPGQSDENDMNSQIKMLSDEVLKLRDKVANHNSEALTLKNRLRSANDRATKAEDQLAAVTDANGSDVLDSMEKALSYPGNNLGRRRRLGAPKSGSIRTAMNLNAASGQRKEQLGKVVDVVDSFAVSTGRYSNMFCNCFFSLQANSLSITRKILEAKPSCSSWLHLLPASDSPLDIRAAILPRAFF